MEKGFFALQRQGVRLAFITHPIVGIGWGGFAKSHYSPTGHEVHSTPLRFLAETGIVGFSLYVLFMLTLTSSVWRGFLLMRRTPFGNSYLALAVGFSSLLVSYAYNRHVTERTFWLLMGVIFAMELFSARAQAATASEEHGRRLSAVASTTGEGTTRPDLPGLRPVAAPEADGGSWAPSTPRW